MSHRRVVRVTPGETASKELAAVVAVGCPRYANTEAMEALALFAQSSETHEVGLLFEKTPNRIDWSFSRIVEAFKKCDAKWLVWNDADVLPGFSFDFGFHHAELAHEAGFDVIASPCMSAEGRYNLRPVPMDESTIRDDAPFEVEFITGGHWWIRKNVVRDLPVVSRLETTGGSYENLYMSIPATTTEDADLCQRIRAMGRKIACHPLLLTDHLKIVKMPSYRKGMPRPRLSSTKGPLPKPMPGLRPEPRVQFPPPAPAPTLTKQLEARGT